MVELTLLLASRSRARQRQGFVWLTWRPADAKAAQGTSSGSAWTHCTWSLPSAAATQICMVLPFVYYQQNSGGTPQGSVLQPAAPAFRFTYSCRPAAAAARRLRAHWGDRPPPPPCTAVSAPPPLRDTPLVHGLPACCLAPGSPPSPAPREPRRGNSYLPRHFSTGMMCVKRSASLMETWFILEDCETYVAHSNAIMVQPCPDIHVPTAAAAATDSRLTGDMPLDYLLIELAGPVSEQQLRRGPGQRAKVLRYVLRVHHGCCPDVRNLGCAAVSRQQHIAGL